MDGVINSAPTVLHEAMEENLHAHIAYVHERIPGMSVQDFGDLLIVDSHLQTDTFNKICQARLTEREADRRIAAAVGYFRKVDRPYSWWVGPCSRPIDLERRLKEHGLRPAETEVGMVADMNALPACMERPRGLEVRRARTTEELEGFAGIIAANWDPPRETELAFYQLAAPALLDDECPMQCFVGYVEGSAVAAGELFIAGGLAGIYSVASRREFRRRGIGAIMTWTLADHGYRQGEKMAMLQATEAGRSLYARLGFSPTCQFVEYVPAESDSC